MVKTMSPIPGADQLKRTKYPPPLTIKFASFSRKPTKNNVAVGGLPGTGKTTVARAAAADIGGVVGAIHWRSDVIRKQLAGVSETTRLPSDSYTKEASDRVYGEMLRRAGETLAAGHPVILDATFTTEGERQAVEELARDRGVPFFGYWLEAPEGELRRRLAVRVGDASDATPAVLDLMRAYKTGAIHWHRLDAAAPEPGRRLLDHLKQSVG